MWKGRIIKNIMNGKRSLLESVSKKLDRISLEMEKFKFVDYVYYLENPKKMLFANFLSGLARGFGAAIGFTILGAVVLYILQAIVMWKLPIIGKIITDIVNLVQDNLTKSGGKVGA